MSDPQFAVGIDLGTTNCVMAAVDLTASARFPDITDIPVYQRLNEDEKGDSTRLPSFLYAPTERQSEHMALGEDDPDGWVLGEAAVEMGRRVPGRLVTSAKSWLCHPRINPSDAILPWDESEEMRKISPLQATIWILEHLKKAWAKSEFARGRDLSDQVVTVTLPASFDQSARQWTLEACEKSGLGHAKLLEEPQAAFYAWITLRKGRWGEALKGGRRILVCDVGGGTSDFSLMQGLEDGDNFNFERVAVGAHLLLGGDNVDLALAHFAETKLSGKRGKLNASQWHLLAQLARRAKETLLTDPELNEVTLRLPGSGRKVIGGLRQATLTRDELNKLVLDGFFPTLANGYEGKKSAGLAEMGLPYESEPAITWHVLDFIKKHGTDEEYPDWVLFNGGSLEPQLVRDRVLDVLNANSPKKDHKVGVLESDSLANAVARGAAYYSYISQKGGLRIGGGSPHSYYLSLGSEKANKVCVLPKGTEPHEIHHLSLKGLEVRTNHPVSFSLFESDQFPLDEVGVMRDLGETLPSGRLNTLVRFGKQGERMIPVEVQGQLTELDTLQLQLDSVNTEHTWDLEFDLRKALEEPAQEAVEKVEKREWDFDLAQWIKEHFSVAKPKSLLKQLEKKLELNKSEWNIELLRDLADALIEAMPAVQKSAQHEGMWLTAMSFSMRPGIGHMGDEARRQKLWSFYRAGPKFQREVQSKSEWSILWRRMAIGIEAGKQEDLYGRTKKSLFDKKGQPVFKAEAAEVWRMIASFEFLSRKDKKKMGDALVKLLGSKMEISNFELTLWAISRFGARLPLQAQTTSIPTSSEVMPWIDKLIEHSSGHEASVAMTLIELSRKCGDINLDISPSCLEKVISYLKEVPSLDTAKWEKALSQVERREISEHQKLIGERLPSGLEINLD